MPIDPFMQNYQAGDAARNRAALFDTLRQRALQSQTEQNTALAQNQTDLMLGALQHLPNVRDTFGGVGAGAILPQFGVAIPQGALTTPDSFTRVRDELALDQLKAGAFSDMAGGVSDVAQQGLLLDPSTGQMNRFETPGEREQKIKTEGDLKKEGMKPKDSDDPKPRKVKVKRYVPGTGEVEYELTPEEAAAITSGQGGSAAPPDQQNQPAQNPGEQGALQQADELLSIHGYDKVEQPLKQQDGTYIFVVKRRGDPNAPVEKMRVYPDGRPPTRER